jgi:hypothetical protein
MIFYRHPDPLELSRIEFDSTTPEKLLGNQVADEISNGKAVRLGRLVNRVGGDQTARPGDVIDNHHRVARYIFVDMPSQDPGIRVEAASCWKPHNDSHGFPCIEILSVRYMMGTPHGGQNNSEHA